LLLNLIIDLKDARPQFIERLKALPYKRQIKDEERLQRELVKQFAQPDRLDQMKTNRLFWAMAYLHRRFDISVLRYILKHSSWFRGDIYETLYQQLQTSLYVKEHPEQEQHLLHDEVRRMIQQYILEELDPARDMRDEIYHLTVDGYYPQTIRQATAKGDSEQLVRQLLAERFGYNLDRVLHAPRHKQPEHHAQVLKMYTALQQEIETAYDYAFEELLWAEMRDYLKAIETLDQVAKRGVFLERADFLHRHSLWRKAEEHYRQMLEYFPEHQVSTLKSLGFALLRQGKLVGAEDKLKQSLREVPRDDLDSIGSIENLLGQVKRAAGRWDGALEHYRVTVRQATEVGDDQLLAAAYLNRAYVWALQGYYKDAREQCGFAIELLNKMSVDKEQNQLAIYAYMNLGSAYRYEREYERADEAYRESVRRARQANDREALGEALQHLGINQHLWGREGRRELLESATCVAPVSKEQSSSCQQALVAASARQYEAWTNLTEALGMAQEAHRFTVLASACHRLAKVYREVWRIEKLIADSEGALLAPEALQTLKKRASNYALPIEVSYESQLLSPKPFEKLDWMNKTLRLFNLSELIADEVNDIHRALDALTEMARLLFELERAEDLYDVLNSVEMLSGYDYQRDLFNAMNRIAWGDYNFLLGKHEDALRRYKEAYPAVARESGYANYLLADRLRDLQWRFERLPTKVARRWVNELEDAWEERLRRNEQWPRMLSFLESERRKLRDRE
jgi:tetratricopeptide (TPR) repeat protein